LRALRGVWVAWRSVRDERETVRPIPVEPYPEVVFLFAGGAPDMRGVVDVLPGEARAWRTLAEMEAARSRVWSRQGRVWDAGMCAGRAQAFQAAAGQLKDVVIDSFGLWDDCERQTGGDASG
jgi:hypothetical protein